MATAVPATTALCLRAQRPTRQAHPPPRALTRSSASQRVTSRAISAPVLSGSSFFAATGSRQVFPPDDFGQPPIRHERFAVFAEDDVAGLEIAMDHAPGMRVGNRLAHGNQFWNRLTKGRIVLRIAAGPWKAFVECRQRCR